MLDEALDLFLGSRCVGCDEPGRMLCATCRGLLSHRASLAWPSPVPDGLVEPWATESYDGAVRALVVGHKDRGQWGHRRVLGGLLAEAVRAATAYDDLATPLLLVPVPSRPGAGRQRGYDATEALVRVAARALRGERRVAVAPLVVCPGRRRPGGSRRPRTGGQRAPLDALPVLLAGACRTPLAARRTWSCATTW